MPHNTGGTAYPTLMSRKIMTKNNRIVEINGGKDNHFDNADTSLFILDLAANNTTHLANTFEIIHHNKAKNSTLLKYVFSVLAAEE
jgi:hypothetical protein